MGSFICRQPNGLLCRFSTVVDCITDYNMTDEEYIEKCAEQAREDARYRIDRHLLDYSEVDRRFAPYNMSYDEYQHIKKEMEEVPANLRICKKGEEQNDSTDRDS